MMRSVAVRLFVLLFSGPALLVSAPALAQDEATRALELDARRADRERRAVEDYDVLVRRLVSTCEADAGQALRMLDDLEKRAAALQGRLTELMTSDDGKRLGQDRTAFLRIQRLRDVPLVATEQVAVKRQAARAIQESIQRELRRDDVGYVPKELERREALEIQYWARERLAAVEEHLRWLTTALEDAPQDIDLAGVKTLEAVIRDYEAERFRIWDGARHEGELRGREEARQVLVDAAYVAERERAEAEAQRRLHEARAEIERLRIAMEVERQRRELQHAELLAELERERQAAEARRQAEAILAAVEQKEIVDEAEKQRLRQRCQDPRVQQLLTPFTTPGYTQPGERVYDPEKQPISYSKLSAFGALAPTRDGLNRLLHVGANKGDQVRPRWGYTRPPIERLKPDQLEHIKEVQALLRELGPTLVELGMLSP